jgi:hypothetical protein
MKHIKIYEEISTSISPDLLGLDGKLITKELALNLIEKYFREKDSQRFNHLMGLIRGNHPQFLKDGDFIQSLGALVIKYNIDEDDPNFILDGVKALPGERYAIEQDSRRSQKYLKDEDDAYSLRVRLDQELYNLADKLTSMYNLPNEKFRAALLKGGDNAVAVLQSEIKSRR